MMGKNNGQSQIEERQAREHDSAKALEVIASVDRSLQAVAEVKEQIIDLRQSLVRAPSRQALRQVKQLAKSTSPGTAALTRKTHIGKQAREPNTFAENYIEQHRKGRVAEKRL